MKTIEIDLTQDDLDYYFTKVVDGSIVEWVFPTLEDGEDILVRFIPYTEKEDEDETD